MVTTSFEKIEKENIEGLRFPENEVLNSEEMTHQRKSDLDRALALGNNDQIKIRIYFEDTVSLKYVETTVWGVTDKRVILKQGLVIPINRIHSIQF